METLLCAAVDTAGRQYVLEACTVCDRRVAVLKYDTAVSELWAQN